MVPKRYPAISNYKEMVTILQKEQVRVYKVEKVKYMKLEVIYAAEGKKQLLYELPSITDQSTFTVVKHKDEGEDWRGDYYKNGYNNKRNNNKKNVYKENFSI